MDRGASRSTSVLLVDDSPDFTFVLEALLQDEGYDVTCCSVPPADLQTRIGARPDLVIVDVWLRQTDRETLVGTLRKAPRIASVPVLVCAVDGTVQRTRGTLPDGAALLMKPFEVNELLATVWRMSGRRN